MFVNRSDERSWAELSTREIVVKTLVLWAIAAPFIANAIAKGFQYFDMGLAVFVLIGGVSVGWNAVGELFRRRREQETNSHDNDDDN